MTSAPILAYLLCFAFAFLLTWVIRIYALRRAILDIPNDRSSHTLPTPRGGGLAIIICFFLGLIGLIYYQYIPKNLAYALLSGGILITLIGYLDDRYTISAKIRFSIHILAAAIALIFLGNLNLMMGGWSLGFWAIPFALLGIVWLINLYNFMDGIDGLASIQGIFVSCAAGSVLIYNGETTVAYLCFLLAAAISGFLYWNWSPARIFMGDAGSGTLGFIFAVLMLTTVHTHALSLEFWFIILAVFICDATFTLIRRILQGERWYSAHRSHAYQRLVQRGYSHIQVSLGILLFNLCVLLPLACLSLWKPQFGLTLAGLTLLICAYLWYRICYAHD